MTILDKSHLTSGPSARCTVSSHTPVKIVDHMEFAGGSSKICCTSETFLEQLAEVEEVHEHLVEVEADLVEADLREQLQSPD